MPLSVDVAPPRISMGILTPGQRPPAPLLPTERHLFWFLLLVGFALLLFRFPAVPWGLHQDEMASTYESYSLLHTGADRWGYRWPIYFVSWGSGQSVLQAYLNIPFVAVFGLSRLGVRLLPMLLNLLCLPTFFFAVRRWYGNRPALLALAFLALSPWHIMLSRWGVDIHTLPFFLALGLLTFGWAVGGTSPLRIVPCLLPFALAMYTYGIVILMVPILLGLLLWMEYPAVRRSLGSWLASLAFFSVVSAPLAFFTLKSYVFHRDFGFERRLPFTMPLLPSSRLKETTLELGARTPLRHNIKFFALQMADYHVGFLHRLPWSQLPGIHALQTVVYLLFWFALGVLIWRSVRARRPLEPFAPWILSCGVICAIVPLNASRAGELFLPMMALGSYGFFLVLDRLRTLRQQQAAWAILALFVVIPMLRFSREYYTARYAHSIAGSFYPHMPEALADAEHRAGGSMPIYFPTEILLNYVDVLFLDKVDPVFFQHSGATWKNPNFRNFYFNRRSLRLVPHPFLYIVGDYPKPFCAQPHPLADFSELHVGLCDAIMDPLPHDLTE